MTLPKQPPSISIVLPVKNAAATLPAALHSIIAQTWTDWELIAIDDQSTDGSPELINKFRTTDKRIKLLINAAAGLVPALQAGCAAAQGKVIARMDGDDVMHPERLHKQWDYLATHPDHSLVSSLVQYGGASASQAGYAAHVDWINSLITPEEIYLRRFVESPVAHPSVAFRNELLRQHGGYRDGNFPEDYELWLRWLDGGVRFGKVEAPLIIWTDSPSRLSRVSPRYDVTAFYRLKCNYLARWLRKEIPSHRALWLWGGGRITRKRFATLGEHGVRIEGFVDVDPKKIGSLRDGRKIVPPEKLPGKQEAFILAGVGSRGARELIKSRLDADNRVEGLDYLLVA